MRYLQTIAVSAALLSLGPIGEPHAAERADFAIGLVLPNGAPADRAITVRCVEGCDWQEQSFHCPTTPGACYATITRSGVDSRQIDASRREAKPRPMPNSQCLGIQIVTDPAPEMVQSCEGLEGVVADENTTCSVQGEPAADARAYINNDVQVRSPAEEAGLMGGDVLVSLDGAPIRGYRDVMEVMKGKKAGQPFDAQIERDGAPMTVQGRVGIGLSDGTCAIADERVLKAAEAAPPFPDPNLPAFKLEYTIPAGRHLLRCLEGCDWGTDDGGCVASRSVNECTYRVRQERGMVSMLTTSGAKFGHDFWPPVD